MTKRYFANDECWIGDCEICLVPMVVWRVHDAPPPPEGKRRLHDALRDVATTRFADGDWRIDDHMRNIPEHYHAHARPPFAWKAPPS